MTGSNDFLKYVPIFSELNDSTIEQISKIGLRKTFKKDSVVLFEHETGSALFVIVEGKVKI